MPTDVLGVMSRYATYTLFTVHLYINLSREGFMLGMLARKGLKHLSHEIIDAVASGETAETLKSVVNTGLLVYSIGHLLTGDPSAMADHVADTIHQIADNHLGDIAANAVEHVGEVAQHAHDAAVNALMFEQWDY
jgi:hypothetical protein